MAAKPKFAMNLEKSSLLSIAFRVVALILLALLAFYENAGFRNQEDDCSGREAPESELSSASYRYITRLASFHEPNDELVRIVSLSSGEEPEEILSNVCAQRGFLARLIRKLKRSEVSLIVLDKSYAESACASQPDSTQKLAEAIAEGKSRVVIGLSTEILPKAEQVVLGKTRTCLRVSSPQMNFKTALYGLIRLDRDTRRVPLEWPAFRDSGSAPELLQSLALVAAEQVNPRLNSRKRLLRILKSGEQPFSLFPPRTTFTTHSAMKLLCGPAATAKTEWSTCPDDASADTENLHGKVVVIGDYSDCDIHESVIGPIYGVDLQANYLAALLADDVYVPVGDFSKTIYLTLWFVAVQIGFSSVRPLWLAALLCGVACVIIFVASITLLAYWGYLFTFWFQGLSVGIIPLTWVEHWLHGMASHKGQTHSHSDA